MDRRAALVLGNAVIWAAVIAAATLSFGHTESFSTLLTILGGGAAASVVVIGGGIYRYTEPGPDETRQ